MAQLLQWAQLQRPWALVVLQQWALDYGKSVYESNLERVIACTKSGHWPGVSDGIIEIGLPEWVGAEDTTLVMPDGTEVAA